MCESPHILQNRKAKQKKAIPTYKTNKKDKGTETS